MVDGAFFADGWVRGWEATGGCCLQTETTRSSGISSLTVCASCLPRSGRNGVALLDTSDHYLDGTHDR